MKDDSSRLQSKKVQEATVQGIVERMVGVSASSLRINLNISALFQDQLVSLRAELPKFIPQTPTITVVETKLESNIVIPQSSGNTDPIPVTPVETTTITVCDTDSGTESDIDVVVPG